MCVLLMPFNWENVLLYDTNQFSKPSLQTPLPFTQVRTYSSYNLEMHNRILMFVYEFPTMHTEYCT